jgi:hypothetical protein
MFIWSMGVEPNRADIQLGRPTAGAISTDGNLQPGHLPGRAARGLDGHADQLIVRGQLEILERVEVVVIPLEIIARVVQEVRLRLAALLRDELDGDVRIGPGIILIRRLNLHMELVVVRTPMLQGAPQRSRIDLAKLSAQTAKKFIAAQKALQYTNERFSSWRTDELNKKRAALLLENESAQSTLAGAIATNEASGISSVLSLGRGKRPT